MDFQLDIIRAIQSIRFGFLDKLMEILTQIGDQFVFMGVVLVIYWFFNKKVAFKLVFSFAFSAVANELIKSVVKIERPFKEDPTLGVGEETSGYSFPSGHAQNTAVISTVLYKEYGKKNNWLKWVLLGAMIIVPLTRVYLGQHYPTDVLAGLALGILAALGLSKLVDLMGDNEHRVGLYMIPFLLLAITILYIIGVDYHHFKNVYVALGALAGFMGGYAIDKMMINNQFKPTGIKVLYRVLIGLIGVVICYVGLSVLFDLISVDNPILDAIRYAIICLYGTCGSAYLFKKLKV
ncbi:phosphatase PAP2 family protein [Acholeplasma hippikon]|uniref:Undecaprenyl-diphosphatase BcrC n=1 Tax=Acholeplasma hippikon TaxID=264636 RepID=A0A449BJI7_9MOLU|nr:phosphatase PAP2 family protein [Acholeplasma hippikon]VEU82598.1 Undecaprenyl-diphosphatase BcrC [Acholeplasma hippikon]